MPVKSDHHATLSIACHNIQRVITMPLILRIPALLSVFSLLLSAASGEPARGTRAIRILFLNASNQAPRTAHLFDGRSSHEVELSRMNLSPVYKLPGGALQLHLLAQSVTNSKQIPAKAPAALIPETMGDAYLLCLADPENPILPLRIDVVDAGKEKFRDGMMMWFNLTPHSVAGKVGTEKVQLRPDSRVLVKPPTDEADSYPVIMLHMIRGDDQVYPICETRWMHDPKSRQLVFVYEEAGKRLPRIQGFPDFRPPPPETPVAPGG